MSETGMWLYRHADQHQCPVPLHLPSKAHPGDVWQCGECKKLYQVREDQHDGAYLTAVPENNVAPTLRRIGRPDLIERPGS